MTDKGTSGQSVQKSPALPEGLFLMDGIEGLRSLPRHSVDMLLTDPPYGTTRNFWDVPLPLPELWEAVKWAVKPDGAVLFFAQCPYEKMMQQKPRPQAPTPAKPPRGSRCSGCPYWRGIGCVSCYRELMRAPAGGR